MNDDIVKNLRAGMGFTKIKDTMFFPLVKSNCRVLGNPCFFRFNLAKVVWVPS